MPFDNSPHTLNRVLVDARNFDELAPTIIAEIQGGAKFIGFDIETFTGEVIEADELDEEDDEVIEIDDQSINFRKAVIAGFSVYVDESDKAYYVNLYHADAWNRVPWEKARAILDAKPEGAVWVIHNAAFEKVMLHNCKNFEVKDYLCSMQLCVSAYGPDEYPIERFPYVGLGEMERLAPKIAREFTTFNPATRGMTSGQAEVFGQVVGKTSKAAFSYNGYVRSMAYGYGLKQAVKSWFGYSMTTFEEVLGQRKHMGELTGEEVVSYGADDAYWAVRLAHRVIRYIMETNPAVMETFLTQELPMVDVYADVCIQGLRIDKDRIGERLAVERANCAAALRKLKAAVKNLLPFNAEPSALLTKTQPWYAKNPNGYRRKIETWALAEDSDDDFTQVYQTGGPAAKGWADERGLMKPLGVNLSYHMAVKTLMYDLIGAKPVYVKGKLQGDKNARGAILEGTEEANARAILLGLAELGGIDQRVKLYLKPYSRLVDQATSRVYPRLSSLLATRRMAMSDPNGMQLAKRGESTYIRGFYLADEDDHYIVSLDWSQIELVLIGDMSGDPEFAKAYGQLPYDDLHKVAAADVLEVGTDEFMSLASGNKAVSPHLLIDLQGRPLEPEKAYKYWRTEVGKGSNFNYWYSGALSTIGDRMRWTPEQMWAATDRYRQRFAVAEAWRQSQCNLMVSRGSVVLPDHHRRVKFEATPVWAQIMRNHWGRFDIDAINRFADEFIRATQTRAKNQGVNALIQGTCATLAKRSILRIRERMDKRFARFMMPIHDELVWSVHRDYVPEFITLAKSVMRDHPDVVKKLPVDCTASVGRTFEPFHPKKVPLGQIELDEAPAVDWLPGVAGKKLNEKQIGMVLDYLKEAA